MMSSMIAGKNLKITPSFILSCSGFLIITSLTYVLWAIQPLSIDDWIHGLNIPFDLPPSGQELRSHVNRSFFLVWPFAFYKPGSLLVAVFMTSLAWAALKEQKLGLKIPLSLLIILGFPYLGLIGPWNLAGGDYGLGAVLIVAWYLTFAALDKKIPFWIKYPFFFYLTFLTATWHEVWLISFSFITAYLFLQGFWGKNSGLQLSRKEQIFIGSLAMTAYLSAVLYYTSGGSAHFVDDRMGSPGYFQRILNEIDLLHILIPGTKENLVLIKDCIPLFALIFYIKFSDKRNPSCEVHWKLFLAAALGVFSFMYVVCFLVGPIHWRARWLEVIVLTGTFYSFPKGYIVNGLERIKLSKSLNILKWGSLILAVIWFSHNAFRAYVYTNIDVKGWLQYRQMVINHDPRAIETVCCSTLPKGRPKGVAWWDHPWGAQDDRYRYFYGPDNDNIFKVVQAYWNAQDKNTKIHK